MAEITVNCNDDLQYILDNAPDNATIYMKNGVYRQKIVVRRDGVKLIGEERDKTKIVWNDYARKPHSDGGEYNTFRTFTVCVTGEKVVMENLTVENFNTRPEEVGQCVALSVNAKKFRAKGLNLISTQDTLFTAPFPDDLVIRYSGLTDDPAYYDGFIPREQLYMEGTSQQLYEDCKISGTVDFIFGGAEAYFKNCEIISLKEKRGAGYTAAPCHSLKQDVGYVFYGCAFVCGGAEDGSVFLARPWRDFGKCEFIDCTLGKHISPLLFDKWNDTYRDKTARFGYCGLKGETSPVKWCSQIDEDRKRFLLNRLNKLF